jgi:hypothetical protein
VAQCCSATHLCSGHAAHGLLQVASSTRVVSSSTLSPGVSWPASRMGRSAARWCRVFSSDSRWCSMSVAAGAGAGAGGLRADGTWVGPATGGGQDAAARLHQMGTGMRPDLLTCPPAAVDAGRGPDLHQAAVHARLLAGLVGPPARLDLTHGGDGLDVGAVVHHQRLACRGRGAQG